MDKTEQISLKKILNVSSVIWFIIWIYFAAFNWEVFAVNINIGLGFTVISGYPFLLFFVIGSLIFLFLLFIAHYYELQSKMNERERKSIVSSLEKDIEILKLKEVLFKMQNTEMNKNTSNLNALHKKLDELSEQFTSKKIEQKGEEKPG